MADLSRKFNCYCKAYPFPHRPGSGKCEQEVTLDWNRATFRPICNECGLACNAIDVDFGIGPYEYWGSKETQVDIKSVSDCCEAPYDTPDAQTV